MTPSNMITHFSHVNVSHMSCFTHKLFSTHSLIQFEWILCLQRFCHQAQWFGCWTHRNRNQNPTLAEETGSFRAPILKWVIKCGCLLSVRRVYVCNFITHKPSETIFGLTGTAASVYAFVLKNKLGTIWKKEPITDYKSDWNICILLKQLMWQLGLQNTDALH